MLRSKPGIAIALALALAGTAPAMAGMSSLEWIQKWQQLEKRKTGKADETSAVHVGVRVVKVNLPGQKLTISHGPVKKIAMPAMTMTFPVADTTHLKMLKKGDRVVIDVANESGVVKITGFTMKH